MISRDSVSIRVDAERIHQIRERVVRLGVAPGRRTAQFVIDDHDVALDLLSIVEHARAVLGR